MYNISPWLTACRGLVILLIALGSFLGFTSPAMAHPLGNFTINHFARLDIDTNQVGIEYVVDMAEIPAFQALQVADTDSDRTTSDAELQAYLEQVTQRYTDGLLLQVDRQSIPLQVNTRAVSLPPGTGGLPTLRMEWHLTGQIADVDRLAPHTVGFEDTNDRFRIGWRELVVQPHANVHVFNSSAYSNSITNALRSYPQDLLSTPLQESIATLSFTRGPVPVDATPLLTRQGNPVAQPSNLFALANYWKTVIFTPNYQRLNPLPGLSWNSTEGLLLAIAGSFLWGAMHSMSPGHGKTVVGAYLIGTRATAHHALFLALTTTITHTIGVFALGFVTLFAAQFILPEQLYPWLNLLSGLLVVAIGVSLFWSRVRSRHTHRHHAHPHEHHPAHDHHHDHHHHAHSHHQGHHSAHTHSHLPPTNLESAMTWQGLLALGISGGLLPCPAALVLLLGSIAAGNVGFGLVLVLAFSLGLAGVLTSLGLLLVYAKQRFQQLPAPVQWTKVLPAVSAGCITLIGVGISAKAFLEIGFVRF